jgi:predicted dinucleotide-binding enzyme
VTWLVKSVAGETVITPWSRLPNSAEAAEKPLRATLLAETFPGAVAQGDVLVFAKEFRRL